MKNYFEQLVKENVFPGCVYAIIQEKKIEVDCVGNKSLFPNIEKTTLDTIYDVASLTKVLVTNTIITKLLQSNQISLHDKVKKYLPRFRHEEITIFHLLTHTSGLKVTMDWKKIDTKVELMQLFYDKTVYKIQQNAIYTDLNFLFLGFIIEEIYKKPLQEVAKIEIFDPLHMYSTRYLPTDKEICAPTEITLKRGIIQGIVHDEKVALLGGVAGSAGVFSTIYDFIKFVNMILQDGIVDEKEYIKKEYLDLWFKPYTQEKTGVKRSLAWTVGEGRVAGHLCSEETISHTGFTGTTIIIDRKRKLGFIQLSNRIHPSRKNEQLLDKRGQIFDEIIKRLV